MPDARAIRALLATVGLLAAALWLPIAAVTYVPGWHAASCQWHARCAGYDEGRAAHDGAQQRIAELRRFMQHGDPLDTRYWTEKERTHLAEVRSLLDRAALIALLGALVFLHAGAQDRANAARRALLIVAACLLVLPFFRTFWREIFHPLLFSNELWMNKPADTSWWVMPRLYFQYTTALVIGCAALLCAAAWWQARRQWR